jgi:internalin A
MSTARFFAAIVVITSLQCTLLGSERFADARVASALERLSALGARISPGIGPDASSSSQPTENSPPFDARTVAFFNTSLTDLDLASVADALLQIPNIAKLDLSYTKVRGECLSSLAAIASLREIDLSGTPISTVGLVQLTLFDRLTSINLNHTSLPLDGFVCFQSAFASRLTTMGLSGVTIVDGGFRPLDAQGLMELVGKFTVLRRLDFGQTLAGSGSTIFARGITDLTPLIALRELRRLDLSNNHLSGKAVGPLAELTKLESLNLAGNTELSNESLMVLWPPNLYGLPEPLDLGLNHLTNLNLAGTKLTDAGLWAIAQRNAMLTELNLSGTPTFVHSSSAGSVRKLTRLTTLNASGTGLDDPLFREIGKDDRLKVLASLDISGTVVTNHGLALDEKPGITFPQLKNLYCADTKVTTAGVNRRNALASLSPSETMPSSTPAARPDAQGAPATRAVQAAQPRAQVELKRFNYRMRP